MMRRNLYILAIASLLSGNYVFAQDAVKQWSLEECIQYAIEHNIDLKQKEQEQESRKVDLHTSKYSWLPALNGSLGQSFQFVACIFSIMEPRSLRASSSDAPRLNPG